MQYAQLGQNDIVFISIFFYNMLLAVVVLLRLFGFISVSFIALIRSSASNWAVLCTMIIKAFYYIPLLFKFQIPCIKCRKKFE